MAIETHLFINWRGISIVSGDKSTVLEGASATLPDLSPQTKVPNGAQHFFCYKEGLLIGVRNVDAESLKYSDGS